MPLYFFTLCDGGERFVDSEGTELPGADAAHAYARQVISELMFQQERRTRDWWLEVRDDEGRCLFVLPFVAQDPTLELVSPEWREKIEQFCQLRRRTKELLLDARRTMLHSRALQARADGKPYLAALGGRRLSDRSSR